MHARQAAAGRQIVLRRPLDREALLEPVSNTFAIQMTDAIADHLWDRAVAEGDDGVPQAIALILTRPNGSGQSIGCHSAL